MAAEAGKQRGGRQTVRGMVPSLAVVLLAAGFIYIFVPHDADKNPVKTVGYRTELASARRAAPYPVLAPEGLAKKWRATSVTYEPAGTNGAAWHLGFMTPDDQYAAVEQSDEARPVKFLEDVTQGARKTAKTTRVNGREWTRYEGAKYDALVREDSGKNARRTTGEATGTDAKGGTGKPGSAGSTGGTVRHTTVVTGTASFAQLRELAAALRPSGGART